MMRNNQIDFGNASKFIDWEAHNQLQSAPTDTSTPSQSTDETYQNKTFGSSPEKNNESLIKHFLAGTLESAQGIGSFLPNPMEDYYKIYEMAGKKAPIPRPSEINIKEKMGLTESQPWSKQHIAEIAGSLALPMPPIAKATGKVVEAAKPAIEKSIQYLKPEKAAEELRSILGQGTSKETIEELSKRTQLAKKSAIEEALIPKKELYSEVGGQDVYKISKEKLPEGNIDKFGQIMADDKQFLPEQNKALQSALRNYRKTGNIESFLEKGTDIFGIEDFTPKMQSKIEDILLMPTKRESAYLSDADVASVYSKKGKLLDLHNNYENKPTLNNYDELQSALKTELRKQKKLAEKGSDLAAKKSEQLEINVKNLDIDQKAFSETLPEKLKNLDLEWRTKYATSVPKYEEAGPTIRKLASGDWQELSPQKIINAFVYDNKKTREVLKDLGPSASKNILYLALQKVEEGDAEGLSKAILDLKRTKGFDKFITPEIENAALKLQKQTRYATGIKNALKASGGAIAGGLAIGGPFGATIGAAAPFAMKGAKYGSEALKSALKKYKK